MVDAYLTADHRDHPENGCPSAALLVNAGRHGTPPQTECRHGLESYIVSITEMLLQRSQEVGAELTAAEAREQAVAVLS